MKLPAEGGQNAHVGNKLTPASKSKERYMSVSVNGERAVHYEQKAKRMSDKIKHSLGKWRKRSKQPPKNSQV